MNHYPSSIIELINNISRLPGIGKKTAERLAIHILHAPRQEVKQLALSIMALKDNVRPCSMCFGFSDHDICKICSDQARNNELLCVVEQPGDMAAIEKSGSYPGLYHILSGVLSPMNGIGPENIRIRELVARIEKGIIKEVVIATSTSVEGEATASYIAGLLEKYSVKLTRIASGIPIGGDLKYVDQVTLKRAMETRYAV